MRRSILADGFWLASAASDMIRSYVGLYACCGDLEAIYLQSQIDSRTILEVALAGFSKEELSVTTERSDRPLAADLEPHGPHGALGAQGLYMQTPDQPP